MSITQIFVQTRQNRGEYTRLTTRCTFVGKVMSVLFNMLSRFVIVFFFPKEQVSFNFMAALTIGNDFGAQKNKLSLFPLFPHLFAMK